MITVWILYDKTIALVAQGIEQGISNPLVVGSNPTEGVMEINTKSHEDEVVGCLKPHPTGGWASSTFKCECHTPFYRYPANDQHVRLHPVPLAL